MSPIPSVASFPPFYYRTLDEIFSFVDRAVESDGRAHTLIGSGYKYRKKYFAGWMARPCAWSVCKTRGVYMVRWIGEASVLPMLGWPKLGRYVNDETPTSTLQIKQPTPMIFSCRQPRCLMRIGDQIYSNFQIVCKKTEASRAFCRGCCRTSRRN